jgi:hypothetical protein
MPTFEHAFHVPPTHRLEQVRTRVRAGVVRASYWDHEEYDVHGRLIARYHTFRELSEAGEGCCGWRKYDSNGQMVDAQDLPASRNRALFDEA